MVLWPHYLGITILGRADPGNLDLGDDQEVDRSLGGDVSEGQTLGERPDRGLVSPFKHWGTGDRTGVWRACSNIRGESRQGVW